MRFYVHEIPPESADGIRTEFSTAADIEPGTALGIVRGMERRWDDTLLGWTEGTRSITFTTAPLTGDAVIIGYRIA